MKVVDSFVRAVMCLYLSRLGPAKACVIVVYHDCKHQMNTSFAYNSAADMVMSSQGAR